MALELVSALVALSLAAKDGFRLDVKPGLWETKNTTSTKVEGGVPHGDLSKLPPEQRARMEETLERMSSGKPHTTVMRSCVTEKDLEKGFGIDDSPDKNCERRYLDRSPRHLRFQLKCAQKEGFRMDGAWEVTVKSPELVVMHGEASTQSPGRSSTSKMEMTARRLGSSCGDVKPGSPKTISR